MCDRVRYTSVPPPGAAAAAETSLVNPSYSSTLISTASEVGSVTTTEPICERVEIELAPFAKRIMEPKNIKVLLLSLIGFVVILLLLNIIFITLWVSAPSVHTETNSQEFTSENLTTSSSEILVITSTDIPSTTVQPSTTSKPTMNVSNETMDREYTYFTRRFNRPKSDAGLRNFAENYAIFTASEERMNVAETQFADLSLEGLKKTVNVRRDSNREEERFKCTTVNSEVLSHAKNLHNTSRIPAREDLRRNERMPKVRNQGTTCKSGYAIAALAQIDYFNHKSKSLQYLLCDKHNFHCEGGEAFNALKTAEESGIPDADELPFSENDKWCTTSFNKTKAYYFPCFATAFMHTPDEKLPYHVSTDDFISLILAHDLPAIVEVPVDRSFFFYKGGIYRPKCEEIIGYQPVIVVGYDKRDDMEYWILRYSFGTDWGIEGDFAMEKGVSHENKDCDAFDYAIY